MVENMNRERIKSIIEKVVSDRGLRYQSIELVDGKDLDSCAVTFWNLDAVPYTSELCGIGRQSDEEIDKTIVQLLISIGEIRN